MSRIVARRVLVHRGLETLFEYLLHVAVFQISRYSDADLQDEHDHQQHEERNDHAGALPNRPTAAEEGDYEHDETDSDQ